MPVNIRAKDGTIQSFPNGTSREAIRHAMLAYDNRESWGDGLAKRVRSAIGQVGLAYAEGQRIHGESMVQMSKGAADSVNGLQDLAGKFRALPNTALGLALAGASVGASAAQRRIPSVRFADNAIQVGNSPLVKRGTAITLGNVQVYSPQTHPDEIMNSRYTGKKMRLGDHEKVHTYQQQALGFDFLPLWLERGMASSKNPFEVQADDVAADLLGRPGHPQTKGKPYRR